MDVHNIMNALLELSKGFESSEWKYEVSRNPEMLPIFLQECDWGCTNDHIVSKWKEYHAKFGMGWVLPFYNSLDTHNREEFEEWLDTYEEVLYAYGRLDKFSKVYVSFDIRKQFVAYCERRGVIVCSGEINTEREAQLFYK